MQNDTFLSEKKAALNKQVLSQQNTAVSIKRTPVSVCSKRSTIELPFLPKSALYSFSATLCAKLCAQCAFSFLTTEIPEETIEKFGQHHP